MKNALITTLLLLLFTAHAAANHPSGSVYADVNGLVCDFCARAIDKMFRKQEAVESVDVNLDAKIISVHFHPGKRLDDETIIKLINDSGYDVRALRHGH